MDPAVRVDQSVAPGGVAEITVEGQTFTVYCLSPYTTPYYYVPKFGRVNHYDTLRKLENYIRRQLRKGKA